MFGCFYVILVMLCFDKSEILRCAQDDGKRAYDDGCCF